ncbi:MAG: hypothetical protein KF865_08435 [Bdellovibrionaceae bacterium]|nr:hypothetical protein [Pseudobdellovibrionaceae bacterium]
MRKCIISFLLSAAFFSTLAQAETANRDYFARLKYDLPSALSLLQTASGKLLSSTPEAEALLEDMGYWKVTREKGPFQLTPALERQLRAHYEYLDHAFNYEAGDTVWVKAEGKADAVYGIAQVNHRALIRDHVRKNGADYYLVDVLVDGPDQMAKRTGQFYDGRQGEILYYKDDYKLTVDRRVYSRHELDTLNSPASSLEKDQVGELIDWKNDKIWLDKLESFKDKMSESGFQIDWTQSPDRIYEQQTRLLLEIFKHFKMNRNAPSQSGRGMGLRACGGGVCFDQALVLTYAIKGVGQTLGLKALNLNGTTVNPMGGHGFVRVDIKTKWRDITFEQVIPYEDWVNNKKAVTQALDKAFTVDDPMSVLGKFATHMKYQGYKVRTKTMSLISDPGWADYGVTPDQFARMPVTIALNPIPVDSNRAVNGLAAQKSLAEVVRSTGGQGPLVAHNRHDMKIPTAQERSELLQEFDLRARQCSKVWM